MYIHYLTFSLSTLFCLILVTMLRSSTVLEASFSRNLEIVQLQQLFILLKMEAYFLTSFQSLSVLTTQNFSTFSKQNESAISQTAFLDLLTTVLLSALEYLICSHLGVEAEHPCEQCYSYSVVNNVENTVQVSRIHLFVIIGMVFIYFQ